MQTIIDIFGMIALTGGIAGAVATAMLKVFGERWIGSRFDKEIERLKDEHSRELAHLTYQINGLLDRTTRLNDFEFRVIPEAWGKTLKAFNEASHLSGSRLVHGLDKMDLDTLEDFLQLSPLLDSQKAKVRMAPLADRTKVYYGLEYFHSQDKAEGAGRDMSIYLQANGIFLRSKKKFAELEEIIWNAMKEHGRIKQYPDMAKSGTPAIDALEKRGKELTEEIEAELHSQLWSTDLAVRGTDPVSVETR
nr:hypothetical protein [uncultured Devosia sp.]